MQAGVDALVPVHVYPDLFSLQRTAICRLKALQVGPDHVVLLACGDALGELAAMIRILLPAGFLFTFAANLDFHAVDRSVVRTPDRAEDQGIGWLALRFSGREFTRRKRGPAEAKRRRDAQRDAQRDADRDAQPKQSHSRGIAEVEL